MQAAHTPLGRQDSPAPLQVSIRLRRLFFGTTGARESGVANSAPARPAKWRSGNWFSRELLEYTVECCVECRHFRLTVLDQHKPRRPRQGKSAHGLQSRGRVPTLRTPIGGVGYEVRNHEPGNVMIIDRAHARRAGHSASLTVLQAWRTIPVPTSSTQRQERPLPVIPPVLVPHWR